MSWSVMQPQTRRLQKWPKRQLRFSARILRDFSYLWKISLPLYFFFSFLVLHYFRRFCENIKCNRCGMRYSLVMPVLYFDCYVCWCFNYFKLNPKICNLSHIKFLWSLCSSVKLWSKLTWDWFAFSTTESSTSSFCSFSFNMFANVFETIGKRLDHASSS